MRFNKGDKVSFLNDVGTGIVLEELSDYTVLIETEDGFDVKYKKSELILARSEADYKLEGLEHVIAVKEKIELENKQKKHKKFDQKFNHVDKMSNRNGVVEVDLHIENLIDSHHGMGNAQILQVQMANFIREINSAIYRKAHKLIVIHGVGEGTLKAEIRSELYRHYPNCEYHDASYQLYGYGATEIILHSST